MRIQFESMKRYASACASARTKPRRASSAKMRRAFSSGEKPTVSSVISGFSGAS
jgi:hypothetical protein